MASLPSLPEIKEAVQDLLQQVDVHRTTLKQFRELLEKHFHLAGGALEALADELRPLFQECVTADMDKKASKAQASPDSDIGVEDNTKCKRAYLVTLPHTEAAQSSDGSQLLK